MGPFGVFVYSLDATAYVSHCRESDVSHRGVLDPWWGEDVGQRPEEEWAGRREPQGRSRLPPRPPHPFPARCSSLALGTQFCLNARVFAFPRCGCASELSGLAPTDSFSPSGAHMADPGASLKQAWAPALRRGSPACRASESSLLPAPGTEEGSGSV